MLFWRKELDNKTISLWSLDVVFWCLSAFFSVIIPKQFCPVKWPFFLGKNRIYLVEYVKYEWNQCYIEKKSKFKGMHLSWKVPIITQNEDSQTCEGKTCLSGSWIITYQVLEQCHMREYTPILWRFIEFKNMLKISSCQVDQHFTRTHSDFPSYPEYTCSRITPFVFCQSLAFYCQPLQIIMSLDVAEVSVLFISIMFMSQFPVTLNPISISLIFFLSMKMGVHIPGNGLAQATKVLLFECYS